MKFNISNPAAGTNLSVSVDDDQTTLSLLNGKRISSEIPGDVIGPEYAGYIFRITGGNDKQGFPLMQGVLTNGRARLLLQPGSKAFRAKRDGQMKRKMVRGCILHKPTLSCVSLVLVQKGEAEIAGLTDANVPRTLGPKRASKIRKLFSLPTRKLSKEDQMVVCRYVIRHDKVRANGKAESRAPKVQRLVTDRVYKHKLRQRELKLKQLASTRAQAAAFAKTEARK
ncbi:ribosomal protein S6, eukaryotic [Kipferlia bialata]|uniref:40S ribosomal protein S6 n=1 Tax=Kipferlia bialata TaxID=797122 RepID=A0A9K3GE67_9EUKA|nr:ribosomal protein S6, eukaryotic [Kipferlia bialata]|eukprot:g1502.t1